MWKGEDVHNGYAWTSAGNKRMCACSLVSSGVKSVQAEQKPRVNSLMFFHSEHIQMKSKKQITICHCMISAYISAWNTVARHVANVMLPLISKFAGIFPPNGDSTSQLDVCSWLVLLWLTGPHKLPQLWARIKPPVGTLTYINTCGCTPSLDLHLDVCWYHTKQNSSSFTGCSVSDECMLIWVPMPRDTQSRPGSCLQRRNKRLYSTVLLIFMHNRCESSFRSATLYGRFVANNKQKWV